MAQNLRPPCAARLLPLAVLASLCMAACSADPEQEVEDPGIISPVSHGGDRLSGSIHYDEMDLPVEGRVLVDRLTSDGQCQPSTVMRVELDRVALTFALAGTDPQAEWTDVPIHSGCIDLAEVVTPLDSSDDVCLRGGVMSVTLSPDAMQLGISVTDTTLCVLDGPDDVVCTPQDGPIFLDLERHVPGDWWASPPSLAEPTPDPEQLCGQILPSTE